MSNGKRKETLLLPEAFLEGNYRSRRYKKYDAKPQYKNEKSKTKKSQDTFSAAKMYFSFYNISEN